jgi:hypothetical protein
MKSPMSCSAWASHSSPVSTRLASISPLSHARDLRVALSLDPVAFSSELFLSKVRRPVNLLLAEKPVKCGEPGLKLTGLPDKGP